jgi:hypothetical protein
MKNILLIDKIDEEKIVKKNMCLFIKPIYKNEYRLTLKNLSFNIAPINKKIRLSRSLFNLIFPINQYFIKRLKFAIRIMLLLVAKLDRLSLENV